jgi:hypothetical protein
LWFHCHHSDAFMDTQDFIIMNDQRNYQRRPLLRYVHK